MKQIKELSSHRDPSGFIFYEGENIFRQVNKVYKQNFDLLIKSGLYKDLVSKNLLIPHTEVKRNFLSKEGYKIIKPFRIPFISYSYEWCFSQLKDAALITLKIQKIALSYGMSLKDATSFNIQFLDGRPIFIDTLSFEKYEEGKQWVSYKQFCEQFLAPLSLMAYSDIRLGKFLIDGAGSIPLDLTSKLLPLRAKINPSLFLHIYLQAKGRAKNREIQRKVFINKNQLNTLIDSLINTVKSLKIKEDKTLWSLYYSQEDKGNNYNNDSMKSKEEIVYNYLKEIKPKAVWDVGANTGLFSKISAKLGAFTTSFDNDQTVIEKNYKEVKKLKEKNILPLWIDFVNPSPSMGWKNSERKQFFERGKPDAILALALIHHLAIANNLPFEEISNLFSHLTKWLIIEYVPKEDSQVKLMLLTREDIFDGYTQENFERVFKRDFLIKKQNDVKKSKRIIYLMKSKLNAKK